MAEQQRGPHELRRIARAELAHHLGAMAFERARTDAHSQRALLVGTTFADELQDFTLTPGQRTLAGLRGERRARPMVSRGARCAFREFAWTIDGGSTLLIRLDLLDQRANTLGLLERVIDDLLQIGALLRVLRMHPTELLDLAHIKQKRRERSIELPRNGGVLVLDGGRVQFLRPDGIGFSRNRLAFDTRRQTELAEAASLL